VTKAAISADDITRLENWIDALEEELPPLRRFILPGGSSPGALLHLARTVCRRAERSLVALGRAEPVGAHAREYLNRLSDLLFVLGRMLNRAGRRGDVLWRHERKPKRR
jgi:cob(I)alamin adenosyltransferase